MGGHACCQQTRTAFVQKVALGMPVEDACCNQTRAEVLQELWKFDKRWTKAMRIAESADLSDCYLGPGIVIPDAADRGITLSQLGVVLAQITERCIEECWINVQGLTLEIKTVNLYDATEYIILPATVTRQCSFVELVASSSQVPHWFVSHWWGEPVVDFLQCLTCHSRDRELGHEVPYWVCAYANNQWRVDEALTDDLDTLSFHRAMEKVQGTIAVLDSGGVIFDRLWCGYEAYTSLVATFRSDYKFDIYTVGEKHVVGITDGFAARDGWYVKVKQRRESSFPLSMGVAALGLEIQRATVSVAADRSHILNKIIGSADLNAPIPSEHVRFDELNQALHAQFAASLFRAAVDAGDTDLMQHFLDVMPAGRMRGLMLNFWKCQNFTVEVARALMHALPHTLRSLELNFKSTSVHCVDMANVLARWLQGRGANLTSLNLHDNAMNLESLQVLAPMLHQLHDLGLGFNNLGAEGASLVKEVLLEPGCRVASLNLNKASIGGHSNGRRLEATSDGPIALALGLARNQSLTSLSLRWNELAAHIEHITAALVKNSSLKRLDLNWNGLTDGDADGAVQINSLLDMLRKHKSLSWLSLEGNQITETLPKIKHLMQGTRHLMIALSEEEAPMDVNLPKLVLVKRDSPHRCIFKHASTLLSGREVAMELTSHPGRAIVQAGKKPLLKGGEWQVLCLAIGPTEHAVTFSFKEAVNQRKALSNSDGWLLFPQGAQLGEGVRFELAQNKFDADLLQELFHDASCFDVNEDGTISPAADKNLVLGADTPELC